MKLGDIHLYILTIRIPIYVPSKCPGLFTANDFFNSIPQSSIIISEIPVGTPFFNIEDDASICLDLSNTFTNNFINSHPDEKFRIVI